jgi:hypothetical protein
MVMKLLHGLLAGGSKDLSAAVADCGVPGPLHDWPKQKERIDA